MKTILYANVSANGKVLLSENSNHQVPQEVLMAATQDIVQAGNLVMGRKSFEHFEKVNGGADKVRAALPGVELVWLSGTLPGTDGLQVANNPEAAIDYLAKKGFQEILIGGGTDTYNAFLENDLITDVVLNIVPIISTGGILGIKDGLNIKFKLTGHNLLTADVIQLHFSKVQV